MDVQDQKVLFRHGGLVAVEAVDHDGLDAAAINHGPHPVGKLSRRKLSGVDLLDEQVATGAQRVQIDPHQPGPVDQKTKLLVEDEQGRLLPTQGSSYSEL